MRVRLVISVLAATLCGFAAREAAARDPARTIRHLARRDLGTREGLPQGSVESLAQTPDGYLWLGTQEGLARHDGVRTQVFDRRNTPALPHNRVMALAVDAEGTLWIGTEEGPARLHDGVFEPIPGAGREPINAMVCAADGGAWALSRRRLIRVEAGGVRTELAAEGVPADVRALAVGPTGAAWLADIAGRLYRREGAGFVAVAGPPPDGERPRSLALARDDVVWLGMTRGLLRGQAGAWTRELADEEDVLALHEDRRGDLWAATQARGVLRRGRDGRWERHDRATGLGNDFVHALLEDLEGGLWIGTQDAGAQRLSALPFVTFTRRDGLPGDIVWPVLAGRRGDLWFGTSDSGLVRLQDGAFTTFTAADGLRSNSVQSLHEDPDGALWIGTRDGTLHVRRDETIEVHLESEATGRAPIAAIARDREGALWLGTRGSGALRVGDDGISRLGEAEGMTFGSSFAIHEDRRGRLWVASSGEGLFMRARGEALRRYTTADGLAGDIVNVILEDPDTDDTLWIGTYGGGVGRWRGGRLAAISTAHGLFDDAVFQILDDRAGNLWISCNRGVYRVAKSDLHAVADGQAAKVAVTALDEADGMLSRECNGANMPAGARTDDGRLWFPTVAGLAMLDPARVTTPPAPPAPRVESLLRDGLRGPVDATVTLVPGVERIAIAYTSASLQQPGRLRFRYMLAGYDSDWVDAGSTRVAHYTRLPPGNFEFRVAASAGGPWAEIAAPITLIQRPFFWETGLFRLLVLAGAALLLLGLVRLRLLQARRREQQLERLVAEKTETLRRAQDRITDLLASGADAARDPGRWASAHAVQIAAVLSARALEVWRLSGDDLSAMSEGAGDPPPLASVLAARDGPRAFDGVDIAAALAPSGAVCGALVIRDKQGPWIDSERRLIASFAHQLGGAIELARLQTELAETQARRLRDRAGLIGADDRLGVCPRCGSCFADITRSCPHDGEGLDVAAAPAEIEGRYRLTRRIGGGGMGQVYAAEDLRLAREVAVKIIGTEHFSDARARQRFDHEARIVAQIQHPGVVALYDSGELPSGSGYLVMELLRGADLARVLATHGRGRPAQVVALVRQGAAALAAAHARGIVHRDIKPGNIVLTRGGASVELRLLDFGLAKSLLSAEHLTRTGTLLGTPSYMSPEQIRGEATGPASDVYAFAAVCFEALVGRRLVSATEFTAICLEIVQAPPLAPSTLLPALGARVDACFAAALAKDPGARPASIEAWADELAAALGDVVADDGVGWPEQPHGEDRGVPSTLHAPTMPAASPPRSELAFPETVESHPANRVT